ncbi:MAG: hypothetical protein OEQ53_20945 [Saprospiraceae bacterium]|nr:hypothetical protein [Saprospiraceae bacterium]
MHQMQGSLVRNVLFTAFLLLLPTLVHSSDSYLLGFFGRMHPLIMHFPIVAVILTFAFEWWQGHSQNHHIQRLLNLMLGLSLYSALLTTLAGFFLSRTGDYEGSYLSWHQWSGILLTLAVSWSILFRRYYLQSKKWKWRQIYRALLIVGTLLVLYTGHLGGSITHGPDFVTAPLRDMMYADRLKNTKAVKEPASMQIFGDIIQPILQKKCMKCHNDANQKGGLNMSGVEQISVGGKSEKPGIIPGDLVQSELMVRVSLPANHTDFMPPDGKTPLDLDEKQLIKWWIENGASATDTLGSGPEDSATATSLENYLPKLAAAQLSKTRERNQRRKLSPKLVKLGVDLGLRILSDPNTDSSYYAISMQIPAQHVTDDEIGQLMTYRDVFSKISLVSADISDEGLYYLGQMPNLREIILTKCCITGSGLVHLAHLPGLEVLNLSHTDVTDPYALAITAYPALKEVYLFNAFVNQEIISALDAHLPKTKVCLEEGPYY